MSCSGHLVKDCPENPGPAFDLPPDADYVCHLCGAEGDHYIYSCYKYNYKSASATPPSRKRPAAVDDDDEVPRRIFSREAREGRLSPWEVRTSKLPFSHSRFRTNKHLGFEQPRLQV